MSTPASITVRGPVTPVRQASWLASAGATVHSFVRAWRATREMKRRVQDAAEVRAYARSIEKTMPGMAADLYAAADRNGF